VLAIDVSVVIPVFNSATLLETLYRRLRDTLTALGRTFEIVFVDDGSHDGSWEVLRRLRDDDPDHVIAMQLMRNYGQHNALMCGFRQARGALVVTLDDDLQHPPEEIPKLLAAIAGGDFDLVYGDYDQKQHQAVKNIGSWVINRFYRLVFRSSMNLTAFRVIRRELLETILPYSLNFTFIDGLLAWNTRRIGNVVVAHHPRAAGRSGYSVGKLVTLAFNLFTNFSLLPLQVVSLSGAAVAVGGFGLGTYYVYRRLTSSDPVPGYASTIVSVLMLGGLQLLGMGIIGEYLGRLHLNVNRKPQYSLRTVLAKDEQVEKGASHVGATGVAGGSRTRAA
jgi:undecaprenyl-phosphate 4-deoxy-4-formamido-L-arabinose transferase